MKALEGYHTELAKIREERVPTAEERHCFKEISRVLYAVRGMSFDFVEKEGKPQIELISSK